MTTTEHYGLQKPESNDYVSIDVINQNMDVIDKELKDGADHANNKNNPHGITKSQIGLGSVDNTADADKTVKSAGTATKLATARTIRTNLGSTSTANFDGSANVTPGVTGTLPVPHGGTGAADRASGIYNLLFIGANPITSTTNDTVANWIAKGNGYCFYSTANMITDQPSQYGILINYTYGSEVFQLWHCQPTGPLYIRAGNSSGWNHSWRKIFDNSQTIPVANGGTGVKTLASGAVLIGNGTGAVQTRPITNNTSGVSASGTNIPTCNTLNNHVQFWLNRGAAVHQANTGFTTYMARGIALVTAVPSSITNGCCAFVYQ